MKKALFFLQSGVGGAERITVTIGKSLDRNKFHVIFYLLEQSNGDFSIKAFIPSHCPVKILPNVKGVALINRLRKVLNTERPNIVFSSMIYINTKLLAISPLFKNTKFIIRNNNYLYTLGKMQKFVLRVTYRMADIIIAQTEEMKEELVMDVGLSNSKIIVLHNPVDTQVIDEKSKEKSPYSNSDSVKYVATGRFSQVKGFDILVKAFKMVKEKQPNSELYIIGNTTGNCTEYYQNIDMLIQEQNLQGDVHCLGYKDNPYVYVKNADCFVLSSRNEGLPNVLIEALYLGTPVAATTCIPIIKRIVDEGNTGYLAESENPESLSVAMLKASTLGLIKSTYKSASLADFTKLFES